MGSVTMVLKPGKIRFKSQLCHWAPEHVFFTFLSLGFFFGKIGTTIFISQDRVKNKQAYI